MEMFLNVYNHYIVNVLDILIIAYLFYRIMLIIKGTRTMQILVGILALLAFTLIARDVLHLRAVTWLLSHFWLAAVVIFAVVFQAEIRNVLAQIGGNVWGASSEVKDEYVHSIVEAIDNLGSALTGGLIVIENEIGLRNFIETGVSLNADISEELILSIFKNKSAPLHDGAMIISGDRIAAAGCLLPLSNDTSVKIYGTRHRAGLGLSEITDAIVIISSEETGITSVAYRGELISHISSEELSEIIISKGGVLKTK